MCAEQQASRCGAASESALTGDLCRPAPPRGSKSQRVVAGLGPWLQYRLGTGNSEVQGVTVKTAGRCRGWAAGTGMEEQPRRAPFLLPSQPFQQHHEFMDGGAEQCTHPAGRRLRPPLLVSFAHPPLPTRAQPLSDRFPWELGRGTELCAEHAQGAQGARGGGGPLATGWGRGSLCPAFWADRSRQLRVQAIYI